MLSQSSTAGPRSSADQPNNIELDVESVSKWNGTCQVLKDVSLRLYRGQCMVICGPSGSGKSTLMRCINRLDDYQEGRITVHGMMVTNEPKRLDQLRREVSMVFQQGNLFPHLTILENCTLAPIRVRKMPREDAEELARDCLERVGISDQAHRYPGHLSGAQRQRVAIARSLCMSPRLMLFDEPTSGLDRETVKEVVDTMVSLAEDGITMLCVTHEMGFARKVATSVAFMEGGQILEQNSAAAFLDHPVCERTRIFLHQILR
ncbi:amino acid ABC transporter ATP-binding protein [Paraburkholderia sp. MM5384-R2]|uniref:amino acid ABC transporter ATP-binding protein n=1 Tax=Paraburkholderia sp. MM5384-R2 TaxID=2723097 RepID=UPI0016194E60|nr:amino acid ABC transporter ATP-binding protein [Paraburkholderia sp. MM5384-R2]MBB5499335.1 general L-amino acid transport system ATP-binding protein [Paraburkholderia sp. MM5384-R2]